MINETILVLATIDHRNHKLAKYPGVDCHCNLDFDKNITEPLKKTFSEVIRYDFLKRYLELGVKATNWEILDIVREEQPKYVFWPSFMYEIQETTFRAIRDEGAIVIGWFFDDEVRFNDYSKWWIPYLDYILTGDKWSVDKYRKLGGNAIYSLNFSNPDYFRRLDLPKIYDVSFVGTKIANRQELIDTLKNKGVLVRAFGSSWSSDYVSFDDMVKIYNQSKINLSFMQSYGDGTRPQMKCKIFDICMCGGFLLCEYIPGIEEYYEIGKEIECFHNLEEAEYKIQYYLKHDGERAAIAEAGWKRATSEHTNLIRLSNIFQKIENDIKKTKDDKNIINPKLSEMPRRIRKLHSNYHCCWEKALLQENYKKLWKDELDLSISYNPFNIEAWCYYIIGSCPSFMRPALFKLYSATRKLHRALLSRLGSVPYLRKMKQSFTKRL